MFSKPLHVSNGLHNKKSMVCLSLSSASLSQQVFPELPCIDRRCSSIAHRGVNKTKRKEGEKGRESCHREHVCTQRRCVEIELIELGRQKGQLINTIFQKGIGYSADGQALFFCKCHQLFALFKICTQGFLGIDVLTV